MKQPGAQIFVVIFLWMLFNVVSIKMGFGDLVSFIISCILAIGPMIYIASRLLSDNSKKRLCIVEEGGVVTIVIYPKQRSYEFSSWDEAYKALPGFHETMSKDRGE